MTSTINTYISCLTVQSTRIDITMHYLLILFSYNTFTVNTNLSLPNVQLSKVVYDYPLNRSQIRRWIRIINSASISGSKIPRGLYNWRYRSSSHRIKNDTLMLSHGFTWLVLGSAFLNIDKKKQACKEGSMCFTHIKQIIKKKQCQSK